MRTPDNLGSTTVRETVPPASKTDGMTATSERATAGWRNHLDEHARLVGEVFGGVRRPG